MNKEKDFKYPENTILGSQERLNKLWNKNLDYIYKKFKKILKKMRRKNEC